MRTRTYIIALFLAAAIAAPAYAEIQWDFKVGIGGVSKPCRWSFATITISNTESVKYLAAVECFGVDGGETIFSSQKQIEIPPQSLGKRSYIFFMVPGNMTGMTVEIRIPGRPPMKKTRTIQLAKRHAAIVCLVTKEIAVEGGDLGLTAYFMRLKGASGEEDGGGYGESDSAAGDDVLCFAKPDELPPDALGFDMLHAVVVENIDAGRMSQPVRDAIRNHVASGGRLVLAGGSAAELLRGTFFEEMAGIKIIGTGAANASQIFDAPVFNFTQPPEKRIVYTTARTFSASAMGRISDENGGPVLWRNRYGMGEVFFIAPELCGLAGWNGLNPLWNAILRRDIPHGAEAASAAASELVVRAGGRKTTIAMALVIILFLTFGYAVIIGPVDYIILKRTGKTRFMLRSFFLIIAVFTVLAYVTGALFIEGTMQINAVAWLNAPADAPSSGGVVFSVFSPTKNYIQLAGDGGKSPVGDYNYSSRAESGGFHPRLKEEALFAFNKFFRNQETLSFTAKSYSAGEFEMKCDLEFGVKYRFSYLTLSSVKGEIANGLPVDLVESFIVVGGFGEPAYPGLPSWDNNSFTVLGGSKLGIIRVGPLKKGESCKISGFDVIADKRQMREYFSTLRQAGGSHPLELQLVEICLEMERPRADAGGFYTSGSDNSRYHPDISFCDKLRTLSDAVFVGVARNYLPFTVAAERWNSNNDFLTIVRVPFDAKVAAADAGGKK